MFISSVWKAIVVTSIWSIFFALGCNQQESFHEEDVGDAEFELVQVYVDEWKGGIIVWAEIKDRRLFHQDDIYLGDIDEVIIYSDEKFYNGYEYEE